MIISDRFKKMPKYFFSELAQAKAELKKRGTKIFDLSVGDPDVKPTPSVYGALHEGVDRAANHRYPAYSGSSAFKEAVAKWMERYHVKADPATDVISLLGTKEILGHLALSCTNPGDVILVPEPYFPAYLDTVIYSGAEMHYMPLLEENGFLPDLHKIPADILARAKLMYLNYPNNPTSACATLAFFENVVEFAKKNDIVVYHDAAYIEMSFVPQKQPSILEVPGAFDVAIESHSFSKTFGVAGWRIGFAVGNDEILQNVARSKVMFDSGVPMPQETAAILMMQDAIDMIEYGNNIYKMRHELCGAILTKGPFAWQMPHATPFIWLKLPKHLSSLEFSRHLIEKEGVIVAPGIGFGRDGDSFIRLSVTESEEILVTACEKIVHYAKTL